MDLYGRFYRFGIRPEWLVVHRIINTRVVRDNRTLYLIKWRELNYDMATWEEEFQEPEIPGLKRAVEEYYDLRVACGVDAPSKKKSKGTYLILTYQLSYYYLLQLRPSSFDVFYYDRKSIKVLHKSKKNPKLSILHSINAFITLNLFVIDVFFIMIESQ